MLWTIDPTTDQPLYEQLVARVHLALVRGELATGERLPSARALADSLDLNVHTVLHAYQQLRNEGVIELRRGRGAVVTGAVPEDHASAVTAALTDFVTAARAAHLSPETTMTLLKEELAR